LFGVDYGRWEGRVWRSELCDEKCSYYTAPYDWVDIAAQGGTKIPKLADDGLFSVDLPFDFLFYVRTQPPRRRPPRSPRRRPPR
jgi:hypothetical protein